MCNQLSIYIIILYDTNEIRKLKLLKYYLKYYKYINIKTYVHIYV